MSVSFTKNKKVVNGWYWFYWLKYEKIHIYANSTILLATYMHDSYMDGCDFK